MGVNAVTIGNFDGVHRGHAALVSRAVAHARRAGGRAIVLAFDPHPISRLRPEATPGRLSTFAQRERWLRALGADEVVRLDPTAALLSLTPEAFVDRVAALHGPGWVVEGADFHFGKGRMGNVEVLSALGRTRGFEVEVVEAVEVDLSDQLLVRASSSVVRWLLEHGRVADAARVLGRPYEIEGEVVRGDRRGRELGYPTANLRTAHLLPGDGVYAGVAVLPDGRETGAAINVGWRPTFAGRERRCEAYLMEEGSAGGWAPIAGLSEYGWSMSLRFLTFVRDDVRFESGGVLVEQIGRDVSRARELLAGALELPPWEGQAACR